MVECQETAEAALSQTSADCGAMGWGGEVVDDCGDIAEDEI